MSAIPSSAAAGLGVAARGRAVIAAVGATVTLALGVLLTETSDPEGLS